MPVKQKKKSASKTPKSVDRGGSHVLENSAEPAISSNVHTFQSDESGGNGNLWPSLAEGNVDRGFIDEIPRTSSGISRPTRTKESNKMLNEGVNAEKAVHAKHQRAGHVGELRKRRNRVQELLTTPGAQVKEVEDSVARYEQAFHNFVSSHDNYLLYEEDEERKALMIDSYDNQRDMKLQLDVMVNDWRAKMKGMERPPSECGLSVKSASSRNSVKEKKRMIEEAKLEMQTLKERQELQRKLEEVEKGKAELSRKIKLLDAKTKVKQAEMDLLVEQSVENEGGDGMNDYLKEHYARNLPNEDPLLQPGINSAAPISESQSVSVQEPVSFSSAQLQPPLMSARETVTTQPVVTLSSTPRVNAAPCSKPGSGDLTDATLPHSAKCTEPISSVPRFSLQKTTPKSTTTSEPLYTLAGLSPIRNQLTSGTYTQPYSPRTAGVNAKAAEFYPVITPQKATTPLVHYPSPLPEEHSSLQSQQSDAWVTIAQAIKQGPSLPKVELMKFSGDPLEYAEFVTNFRDNIESQVSDESQRLTRLLAQCTGKAKEAIRSCVNLPVGYRYSEAWKTLHENFGQSHMIVEAHMKKLREIHVRKADALTLMDFARRLEDARRVLTSMGGNYAVRLDSEDVIILLMRKLPDESLKRKWADRAGDLIKSKGQTEYVDFVRFIKRAAERINNRYGQELKLSSTAEREKKEPGRGKSDCPPRFMTLATRSDDNQHSSATPMRVSLKCPQCSGPHGVWRCRIFRSSSLRDRLKTVRQHRLCRICLSEGHGAKQCTKGFTCGKAGCSRDHHYLIHSDKEDESRASGRNALPSARSSSVVERSITEPPSTLEPSAKVNPVTPSTVQESTAAASSHPVTVSTARAGRPRVCFKVVPVKISGSGGTKEILTYAFLDSGSDATFCLESLVQELDLKDTKPTTFTMTTVNCEEKRTGHEVQLNMESLDGDVRFQLDHVLTTNSLPVTPRHMATNEEIRKWSHLDDVSLPETGDKKVTILIGSDRPDIIDKQLDKREGDYGQPSAVKTPLGWTVFGPIGNLADDQVHVSFTHTQQEILNAQLERMYNEDFGDTNGNFEEGMSIEDRKAREIMDQSATLVNGHYQIRLPFRQEIPNLPDSLSTAEKRLMWLKRKMQKDPVFHTKYSSVMEKYGTEGSSRQVPDDEVTKLNPIWYLPHHAVWHPRKPEEPRVVFDCASKSGGTSLNEQLLRGPENTSTLIGVIQRFRVDDIAVTADIKRMFHQVYVAPEDSGALCYLWWPNGDLSMEPKTYQMLVHIFGVKSSPSVAGYALGKTAKDNERDFSPEIIDAVSKDFYVDDLLKSFADSNHAVDHSRQLQELLARGGFQLTKWNSNCREVLSAFPVEERAPHIKDLDLKSDSLPLDRALGIHWDVERDTINFVFGKGEQPRNRKGVLSSIATVYDPLGFASPLLLPGREINQELCKLKFNWNDDLPEDLCVRWRNWREGLMSLQGFSIPRCFKPGNFGKVERAELHHFADASQEHGYGTASYLRLLNDQGQIHCSFVMGKSRVKPLKSAVTVPKLELTAATLATRINKVVVKELEGRLMIDSVTYWTDSMIVLKYIANESRRFVTFVANRVAVIRQESEPSQWRHVRTELNPADYASRGIKASETRKLKRWKRGPEFLWKNDEEWSPQPAEVSEDLLDSDEGVKKEKITIGASVVQKDFWSSLFERYSKWDRLRRVVAWLICVFRRPTCSQSKAKVNRNSAKSIECSPKPLSVSEVSEAEKRIVKYVQVQSFPCEVDKTMMTGQLARLKPFKDEGILRVGGRLKHSNLQYDAKYPMILPAQHPVTEMIIRYYHDLNGHVGSHQVLAEIRQRFWIVKGVSSVKRILRKCHVCKRQTAKLGEQVTAQLPVVRVSSDSHRIIYPFAAVGLDYFGPLYIKNGPNTRSKRNASPNKRYGCIFTCLRYRAVHIEVAEDLTTDSFINAVLRFVGRRGPPTVIYSDNGSNFRGAEVDVVKALQTWDQQKIQVTLTERGIEWKFNPPAASHQGGVWERLIRSIRRILYSLVGERLLSDETLRTFLVEVEKILNDRPITPVSSDPRDLDALTPSHILLLRRNPCSPPDVFNKSDQFKARWKLVHLLANEFWQRWTKEYLPTLQERQKWLRQQPNFEVGDLVLMADKNTPRGQWPKAFVEQTFPDSEGIVRQVVVRTADGVYRRDVRKLCMLEEKLLSCFEGQNQDELYSRSDMRQGP